MTELPMDFPALCADVVQLYRDMAGDSVIARAESRRNLIGRRITSLRRIVREGVHPAQLSEHQATDFFETILDAVAIRAGTASKPGEFAPLTKENAANVGGVKKRRAIMLESDERQRDWHFQLLVQGWALAHSAQPIRDLANDARFHNGRVCDYTIVRPDGRTELLECKRFHADGGVAEDFITAIAEKAALRFPGAIEQLQRTREIVGGGNLHLLVDVTSYLGVIAVAEHADARLEVGGLQGEDVGSLVDRLTPLADGLDQLTLCWHAPIKIDGLTRALIQRSRCLLQGPRSKEMLEYSGWTVEFHPSELAAYRYLKISTVARSLAWVLTSYRNSRSPETFFKFGPPVDTNGARD